MVGVVTAGYCGLPEMQDVSKPNPDPGAQQGWDTFLPPVTSTAAAPGTPSVGEWTRCGVSDDSLVLTGDAFSSFAGPKFGKDTQFLVYGQTDQGNSIQSAALIQRLDGSKAAVTLPAGLPAWSTYFLWPANSSGYGYPVGINRTDAWWVGPDRASPGGTISVYGRNLSHNNGTATAWVYLKPSGSAALGQWATVTSVNPYRVQFTVPGSIANGAYEVWVHNGHGGGYGWSGPLSLTVSAPYVWDSDSGGNFDPASPATFNVKNYGAVGDGVADDAFAVDAASNAAANFRNNPSPGSHHSTIYFPAGTYALSHSIGANSNLRYKGDGIGVTFLKCGPGFLVASRYAHMGLVFGNGGDLVHVEVRDMTLDANGNFGQNVNQDGDSGTLLDGQWNSCDDFSLTNVCIRVDQRGLTCARFTANTHLSITNCSFYGGDVFLFQGSRQSISDCNFFEDNDQGEAIRPWGISELSITGCTAQDSYPSPLTGCAEGRFVAANSEYGTQSNIYIGDNATIALGPPPNDNSGEKILCEGNYTRYSSNPTSETRNTVTFGGLASGGNWTGLTAVIVGGKGLGQYRLITGYDGAQTFTVSPAWNVLPDANSTVIVARAADRWVVYHNDLEGQPFYYNTVYTAMTAIEPYGGCYEWIGDSNTIKYMYAAMCIAGIKQNDLNGAGINPCFFNFYVNNSISSCFEGIRATTALPTGTQDYGTSFLGTVFRGNTLSDISTVGVYQSTNGSSPPVAPGKPYDLTLFEHNTLTNLPDGFNCDINATGLPVKNVVLYKNSFDRGTASFPGSFGINFVATTLDPTLKGNNWTGFETTYAGTLTGAVINAPVRSFGVSGAAGGRAQTAAMTIWNSGTGPLNWTVASDSDWLTFSSGSGTVADENSSSVSTLLCNPAALQPGTYSGTVTIRGTSRPEALTVTFMVSPGNATDSGMPLFPAGAHRALVTK
jgi:hypothetical protein